MEMEKKEKVYEPTGEEYWQMRKPEIKKAFGEWLGQWDEEWDLWVTFTFENNYRAHSAKKAVIRFLRREVPGFSACLVIEPHKAGFTWHVHALIGNAVDVRRRELADKWAVRYGWARIEEYDPEKRARFYIGKYLVNPIVDYDFINMKRADLPLFSGRV